MSRLTDAIDHARSIWSSADAPALETLRVAATRADARRSLAELLSVDSLVLIVEPKRATATRGTINPDLDIASVARECEAAGAHAISIVTEPLLSGGSSDDLTAARSACDLPLIARDLIVDPRQVYALRAAGADALLLPAEIHLDTPAGEQGGLDAIVHAAHELGMEVALSVRTDAELVFALDTDVDVLNIDNRADDDGIDVERTFDLLADVPVGWPVMSESIEALDQVTQLHHAGVDALLLDEGHLDTGLTHALAIYADLVR